MGAYRLEQVNSEHSTIPGVTADVTPPVTWSTWRHIGSGVQWEGEKENCDTERRARIRGIEHHFPI